MTQQNTLIIVTGAAGMIGSGVVRSLNDLRIEDLLLVDDLKSGEKWKNLLGKKFVNLISKYKLFEFLQGRQDEIAAIIHLGACSDTVETNADYLLENNFHYTIKLAEWALTHNKRFIYASSASTYGDGSLGFVDDEAMLDELKPLNMYAFSKQLVDQLMKRQNVFDRVVGLKYFNVFGPNEYHKGKMASMVLKMLKNARDLGTIQLYKSNHPDFADGEQLRDFIYLKDAVKMTVGFLKSPHAGIFNIATGKPFSWNQLAGALFGAMNQKTNIEYIDMPSNLSKQYQNYTCADMKKFQTLFPSELNTLMPTEFAVKEYVQEYLVRNARW